ncbi:hypothetical protein MJG53_001097 [Ovis ammon polii x Ovis aries]|uniref:Uncharacterized protein n=1 Tax=Ovis ammon polii x Ovis aries TaxID=2918886 RepID=A0ACB9VK99_9CETA|nr:hypothetical protein MJT46_000595 [Ovis ammon polii x Ovis aries]KAI4590048.1 hypothetical protein MJG53_001097 [Ovis ammon polii x Ovis aries]
MRKSKRKEKVKIHCPGILPTPFVPPQSEEDKVGDKKLTLLNAKEHYLDLPKEDGLQSRKDEVDSVKNWYGASSPQFVSYAESLGSWLLLLTLVSESSIMFLSEPNSSNGGDFSYSIHAGEEDRKNVHCAAL